MEYPSRSNLNCFLSFNEASAKGDEFRFHSGLSTSVERGKPLSCCDGEFRDPDLRVNSSLLYLWATSQNNWWFDHISYQSGTKGSIGIVPSCTQLGLRPRESPDAPLSFINFSPSYLLWDSGSVPSGYSFNYSFIINWAIDRIRTCDPNLEDYALPTELLSQFGYSFGEVSPLTWMGWSNPLTSRV